MARPSKEEKYGVQGQKQLLREICGDALYLIRENLKDMIAEQARRKKESKEKNEKYEPLKIDYQALGNFVGKMMPIIVDDNTENANDVTMDLLIKKAIKVNMRITEANEEGLKEDEE